MSVRKLPEHRLYTLKNGQMTDITDKVMIQPHLREKEKTSEVKDNSSNLINMHKHILHYQPSSGLSKEVWENLKYSLRITASSEVGNIIQWCIAYLSTMSLVMLKTNGAVVFDIDDTVLTRKRNKLYTIESVKVLYDHAVQLGLRIFFVTARSDTEYAGGETGVTMAKQDLEQLGFTHYEGLYVQPKELYNRPVYYSLYKYLAREHIREKFGCRILLSVGDQWGDCTLTEPALTSLFTEEGQKYINEANLAQDIPTSILTNAQTIKERKFITSLPNTYHYIVAFDTGECDVGVKLIHNAK